MEQQLVVFELANEFYGINIAMVESIIRMQPITQIPHAPAFVEGIINLRGKVLPVIDPRKRFGLPAQDANRHSRIIVVSIDQTEVGIIVDGVSEVLTISEQSVEAAPAITSTMNSSFITGIAKLDERLVILLDLQRILSAAENTSDGIGEKQ